MAKIIKDVTAITNKSKGKANWKAFSTTDKDGKERIENIINEDRSVTEAIHAVVTGPGKYAFTYAKNGDYWNIVAAERLDTTNGTQAKTTTVSIPVSNVVSGQTAIAVSTNLLVSLIGAGLYKPRDLGEAIDELVRFSRALAGTDISKKSVEPTQQELVP